MGAIMWDDELEQALKRHGRDRVAAAFARQPDNAMYDGLDQYLERWPIRHIGRGMPSFLFLIAEGEQQQPPVLMTNRKFVKDARSAGNQADYKVLPDRNHTSAIRRLNEPEDPTFVIIRDFIVRLSAGKN